MEALPELGSYKDSVCFINEMCKLYRGGDWRNGGSWQMEDLPDLSGAPAASEPKLQVMATMYYWAKASAIGDAHLPFCFKEMGATAQIARDLAGEKVWAAFFGDDKEGIFDTAVCPMQLRKIVFAFWKQSVMTTHDWMNKFTAW